MSDVDRIVWLECRAERDQLLGGCDRDGTEAGNCNFVLNAMCYW